MSEFHNDPVLNSCRVCGATNKTKGPIVPMYDQHPASHHLFGLCLDHAKAEQMAGKAWFWNLYDLARWGGGPDAAEAARVSKIRLGETS
jgi:hypothetical protein